MKKISINSACPCGSGKKYKKCCMSFHKGAIPKDALTLMKSRYSAFAVGDIKYIIKTSIFQKDFDDLKIFSDSCEFKKLEILEFLNGKNEAFVTFKATVFCNQKNNSFREKSRFVKIDNRWFYKEAICLK